MDEPLKIFIGVVVSLLASCLDALGLNIQKRDHLQNSVAVKPRHDCCRLNWHLGLYVYCGSQAIGNTVALNFLKAQWLAPLGALSLVFNFIFARVLVGTNITKVDLFGTTLILLAILIIVLLGAFFGPQEDIEANLTLFTLRELLSRLEFKIYFACLNFVCLCLFGLGIYTKLFLEKGKDLKQSYLFYRFDTLKLTRILGISISALGGIFASETLILAKSGIKLIVASFKDASTLADIVSIVIVIALGLSVILQIYCLNAGLKYADSVVSVPTFACTYNIFGLANSMIYFNQFDAYPWWIHLTNVLGIIVLIYGITTMSKQDKLPPKNIPYLRVPFLHKLKRSKSTISYSSDEEESIQVTQYDTKVSVAQTSVHTTNTNTNNSQAGLLN
ncbi:hypothetical protein K502DRAFT_339235 [Neoconidiobolus thromboides FSU 785]|nr:hypothetical protein K502DRAFT_339235 [Neoconidiobolus thromboides FSU 785]